MDIGMIGLGRMGANMVRRLMNAGHRCVVFDRDLEAVTALAGEGAVGAKTLEEMVEALPAPRAFWLMVPAAVVDSAIADLKPLLTSGDTIIDGGNSYYIDDIRRAKELAARGACGVPGAGGAAEGEGGVVGGQQRVERAHVADEDCPCELVLIIQVWVIDWRS